jgi:hypothetical protein
MILSSYSLNHEVDVRRIENVKEQNISPEYANCIEKLDKKQLLVKKALIGLNWKLVV